jgi:hypothetical protein
MIDKYYKKLFLDNYRTKEEADAQIENTDEFALWLLANQEQFNPVFSWFLNFYFNGLDENARSIVFEEDLVNCAKNDVTKLLFLDTTAQGAVEGYSLFGVMCLFFKHPYDFDQEEVDYVCDILEKIRIGSGTFSFRKCDWEYFLQHHWYGVCAGIMNTLASDPDMLKDSFLIQETTRILEKKGFGVPVEFIEEDDRFSPPHSGYGVDLSKFFNSEPLVITMSECTHHANFCDVDLAKQS